MKRWILILGIFFSCFQTYAQVDTLFWFAVPEVAQFPDQRDRPILLRLTAHAQGAYVHVRVPGVSWFTSIVRSIAPNQTVTLDLTPYIDSLESKVPNQVQRWGIYVWSDKRINAYWEVGGGSCGCNAEIFSLKGKNALGTAFRIPMQNLFYPDRGAIPGANSSFDIVATRDSTLVSITPSVNVLGHAAGVPFQVFLHEGQTYSVVSDTTLGALIPAGSYVSSNFPIAITVKQDAIGFGTGCLELIGDQILPIERLGQGYVAVNGGLSAQGELISITTTAPNTSVFLRANSTPFVTLPQAGSTFTFALDSPNVFISANEPIAVFHVSGIGCQMGAAQLPPVYCTGSHEVGVVRSGADTLVILLTVNRGGEANFLLNGVPNLIPVATFLPVTGGGNNWLVARYMVPNSILAANNSLLVRNTSDVFQMAVLHGGTASQARYAYFSNYSEFATGIDVNSPICMGDSVKLSAAYYPQAYYRWRGPNGFNDTVQNPRPFVYSRARLGWYIVEMTIPGCSTYVDSIFVRDASEVNPKAVLPDSLRKCSTDTLLMAVPRILGMSYQWIRNGVPIANAVDTFLRIHQPGRYYLRYRGSPCFNDSTNVLEVRNFPTFKLSLNSASDTSFCEGHTIDLRVLDSNLVSISWYRLGSGLVISTSSNLNVSDTGSYYCIALDTNGCRQLSDTIQVLKDEFPNVRLQLHPNASLCRDSVVALQVIPPPQRVDWIFNGSSIGQTQGGVRLVNRTGEYQALARYQFGSCDSIFVSEPLQITMRPLIARFSLSRDTLEVFELLNGINNSINATGYRWDTNGVTLSIDKDLQISFERRGNKAVKLVVQDSLTACVDSLTRWVRVNEPLVLLFPNIFSPNGDGINDKLSFVLLGADELQLKVFNRWGQEVFSTNNFEHYWDGNQNGQLCPAGNYLAVLQYRSETSTWKVFRKEIQLIR